MVIMTVHCPGGRTRKGLQDPTLIARVLNSDLDAGTGHSYVFRIAPSGELKQRLRMRVHESVDRGYPVVINMNSVDGDSYPAGHYIAIVGYRSGRTRSLTRTSRPATASGSPRTIVAWYKLNRFTAFA